MGVIGFAGLVATWGIGGIGAIVGHRVGKECDESERMAWDYALFAALVTAVFFGIMLFLVANSSQSPIKTPVGLLACAYFCGIIGMAIGLDHSR